MGAGSEGAEAPKEAPDEVREAVVLRLRAGVGAGRGAKDGAVGKGAGVGSPAGVAAVFRHERERLVSPWMTRSSATESVPMINTRMTQTMMATKTGTTVASVLGLMTAALCTL